MDLKRGPRYLGPNEDMEERKEEQTQSSFQIQRREMCHKKGMKAHRKNRVEVHCWTMKKGMVRGDSKKACKV